MVILLSGGQLSNQLFTFGHVLASAVERGYDLANPRFAPYSRFFPAARVSRFAGRRVRTSLPEMLYDARLRRLVELGERHVPGVSRLWSTFRATDEEYDLSSASFWQAATNRLVIAEGWLFRDYGAFRRQAEVIKKYFSPDSEVTEEVRALVQGVRERGDCVVGVHVRRGDYREWEGGRFWFGPEVYARHMQRVTDLLRAQGRTSVFVVSSNEEIQVADYQPANVVTAPGDVIRDLHALALCDYLIGPPSTFSMWASFYGSVPLQHITGVEAELLLSGFAVCGG